MAAPIIVEVSNPRSAHFKVVAPIAAPLNAAVTAFVMAVVITDRAFHAAVAMEVNPIARERPMIAALS